jgi:hypothetical protein
MVKTAGDARANQRAPSGEPSSAATARLRAARPPLSVPLSGIGIAVAAWSEMAAAMRSSRDPHRR